MTLSVTEIQQTLLDRDAAEDNPWSIWVGADAGTASQLLNLDDSNPYLRQVSVTNEMLAYDTSLKLDTEVYRLTLVRNDEPNANAAYWLSSDGGVTKERLNWSYRRSRAKRSYWWIFFKRSG
ncbi:hypothetical protein Xen7305DRAFT_00008730 [Xenococcus sp. PCC 7305]|uniref:hypothetical protein n=1 Tax=Xenococcus sp. PCC 7305 TaxID=102125 RepID=UPI0002ABB3FA|nr:hypothetical protein [Xenococcus sp. PCC 7305]ELS01171.1 hypothetical protein Xen7305DRAFT_00008730 [Xenococcus sp. PCC 7305]